MRSGDDVAPRPPPPDADAAVVLLYDTYYGPLTRLAALLANDETIAEEIVRDAFVAMHGAWRHLRDNERALRYLQQAVVRRSRSPRAARRRTPGATGAPPAGSKPPGSQSEGSQPEGQPTPGNPTLGNPTLGSRPEGEQQAPAQPAPSVVAALRSLPVPQREALVLRYYADLPETRIASVMGISTRAVSSHIAYGMSSMQAVLGPH